MTYFNSQAEYQHMRSIQSFYDPALREFYRLYEIKKANLRKNGNDEKSAAVTRNELIEALARKERITIPIATQVVKSLVKAGKVTAFGMYAGNLIPKVGEE